MSEQSQKTSLRDKLKNTKINRASLITALLVIVALTVIISVTVASNRSKKKVEEPKDTKAPVDTMVPNDTQSPVVETPPTDTKPVQKPVDTGSSQVENKLPSFVLPVSGVISKKHDPSLQVFSNTMKDYRVHLGIDIVTDEASPVYAAADGKVDKIWEDPLMGNCIAVKHSGDCYTIYKNLAADLPDGIAEGTSVRAGQMIATVGESAMVEVAEEPHLHFEMTVADLSVNPLEYFDEKALETLKIDASYGE